MVLNAPFNNNGLGLWFLTPLSIIMCLWLVFNATFNNNGLGLGFLTPHSTIMG
jgi:hypothetical protein